MDLYHKTQKVLLELNNKTKAVFPQIETFVGSSSPSIEQWKVSCTNIRQNLVGHVARVAVVGAIKSGKSTLVNALLQDDYLKRGAGVVTSIVTRIRRGDALKANLYFKSWDEINADIDKALVLFPSKDWPCTEKTFDIRRSIDRANLKDALNALDDELKITKDSLNANSVLLSSYLKGYAQVKDIVQVESTIREFKAHDFRTHRTFVSDDALAVYLKDIQLDITTGSLETNIEMADCQGSDSPNPLHMAMIQDYLLKAHLIIYVVSSRIGLRQADIKFLNIIKQMGIADNMLFVCNCDFDEHESYQDLKQLVRKVKEELSISVAAPNLFVFSALYHLFETCQTELSSRDKNRMEQWASISDLIAASRADMARLKEALSHKLTRERSALLLRNQLERIAVVHHGLLNWIDLNRDLIKRNTVDVKNMVDRIQNHREDIEQVETMIGGTLNGSFQKINSEFKKEVDRFFDRHSGGILHKIVGFIHNYQVDDHYLAQQMSKIGFNQTLYLVFQEFKQALDAYMAEKINPEIIGFINGLENRLKQYFHSVVGPFEAMVRDAIEQYKKALGQFEVGQLTAQWGINTLPEIETIKQSLGLEFPPATATMRYSAHIKTDAVLRLGFYSFLGVVQKIFNKQSREKEFTEIKAFNGVIRRMKRETEQSVYMHFKDYQENFKFQYLLRLVEAISSRLFESLTEHFQLHVSDLKEIMNILNNQRSNQKQVEAAFIEIEEKIHSFGSQMNTLRSDIERLGDNTGVF